MVKVMPLLPNSIFVLGLIRERVAIIVFHWEGLVFRALHSNDF